MKMGINIKLQMKRKLNEDTQFSQNIQLLQVTSTYTGKNNLLNSLD